jgi:hypothetical protein
MIHQLFIRAHKSPSPIIQFFFGLLILTGNFQTESASAFLPIPIESYNFAIPVFEPAYFSASIHLPTS